MSCLPLSPEIAASRIGQFPPVFHPVPPYERCQPLLLCDTYRYAVPRLSHPPFHNCNGIVCDPVNEFAPALTPALYLFVAKVPTAVTKSAIFLLAGVTP